MFFSIQVLQFFLFIMEVFNAISHLFVGMGLRMLPYKDMVQLRSYFLFSILTLATTMLTIDCPLYLLDAVVMGHHLFCYLTWDNASYSKKVILWSSLNWREKKIKEPILFFGSLLVSSAHAYHGYLLGQSIKFKEIVIGLVITQSAVMAVMYNSRLAWATPGNVPSWVQKRVDSMSNQTAPTAQLRHESNKKKKH